MSRLIGSVCVLVFFVLPVGLSRAAAPKPRREKPPRDNTSKVPRYTFADTLEEQEEQLRNNPLLQRFQESRDKTAGDPHRPIYHYVNPEGRLNDPDGKGGVIVIFNMNPGKPTRGWNQIMTLPRRLTLAADDPLNNLNIVPAGEVESLRRDHQHVDRSVVEVFVNEKQCVALRVYPGREDSVGVSLRAQGQEAKLRSLDAWQMENIWE